MLRGEAWWEIHVCFSVCAAPIHLSPNVCVSHLSAFQLQTVPNVDVYHNEKGCLVCVSVHEHACVWLLNCTHAHTHSHVCDVCGNE